MSGAADLRVLSLAAALIATLAIGAEAEAQAVPPGATAPREPPEGEAALGCRAAYPLTEARPDADAALRQRLDEAGFGAMIDDGALAVGYVDLDVEPPRYAALDRDRMFYAASLPKIVLLLGLAQGEATDWSEEVAARSEAMICGSSNQAATWAFERIGLDRLERLVRAPGLCLYGNRHGGLWVGRAYGRGRPTKRDPIHGISHGATVRQVLRFYTLLERGQLAGPEATRRMLGAMSPPSIRHKFVKGLADRSGVRFLARKSGTWRAFHSDSALVEHGGHRYAAVALSEHPLGARAVEASIRIIDDLVVGARDHQAAGPTTLRPPISGARERSTFAPASSR